MSTATVTLSSQGQIEIPKHIRDELHWEDGHALFLETTEAGILLRAQPATNKPLRLESLRGFLKPDGPSLSTEDLSAPVDASADWDAAERRSR
ncbi:AbrB/MazE/SpoVT family DNA-binding domain-containing protein [Thiocystis violacea]|uniref:AbrB/MazE/SpoVT family DNA-binding domain-containing protein n=1 Tax=Thiocystis violacea TaxID=13725 RepID=UPI0019064B95|nr:AbrB/MazE/SpoVT family DNA-binding domain-containing protein [Thiocystis violacea]MBK1725062.1 AbrB family transcriptional regulator [Thiocystis violacea]